MDLKGPRSPKHVATICFLRSYLSPLVFTVRSGPVWRQDLAILSPEGPRDNTRQLCPESKKRKSPEANSGSIHTYGRHENDVKTRKTISTIAILWPVKTI